MLISTFQQEGHLHWEKKCFSIKKFICIKMWPHGIWRQPSFCNVTQWHMHVTQYHLFKWNIGCGLCLCISHFYWKKASTFSLFRELAQLCITDVTAHFLKMQPHSKFVCFISSCHLAWWKPLDWLVAWASAFLPLVAVPRVAPATCTHFCWGVTYLSVLPWPSSVY